MFLTATMTSGRHFKKAKKEERFCAKILEGLNYEFINYKTCILTKGTSTTKYNRKLLMQPLGKQSPVTRNKRKKKPNKLKQLKIYNNKVLG